MSYVFCRIPCRFSWIMWSGEVCISFKYVYSIIYIYPSVNRVMHLGVGYVTAMLRQQGAALFQDQWFADGRRKENGLSTGMPPEPRKTYIYIWVFPKIGVPQIGWFIKENPIKMDDLGVPLFLETPIYDCPVLLQLVPWSSPWKHFDIFAQKGYMSHHIQWIYDV